MNARLTCFLPTDRPGRRGRLPAAGASPPAPAPRAVFPGSRHRRFRGPRAGRLRLPGHPRRGRPRRGGHPACRRRPAQRGRARRHGRAAHHRGHWQALGQRQRRCDARLRTRRPHRHAAGRRTPPGGHAQLLGHRAPGVPAGRRSGQPQRRAAHDRGRVVRAFSRAMPSSACTTRPGCPPAPSGSAAVPSWPRRTACASPFTAAAATRPGPTRRWTRC